MIDEPTIEITVIQPGVGSHVEGRWVDGPTTTEKTWVSVQPYTPKPHEIQMTPDGRHDVEAIRIYTELKMFPSSEKGKKDASTVLFDGDEYEVHKVHNWAAGTDDPHYKVIAFKIEGADA